MRLSSLRFALTFALAAAAGSRAQTVPATINYQGRLTDNTPAQTAITATVPMQFAIYDAASGGTRLWQEPAADNTAVSVTVTGGIFNYVLGNIAAIPASVFTGATSIRYLQITLNPAASAEILTPRQLVTATGYANLAQNANSAVSATTAITAANSTQLGGVAASGYLLTSGTAADSSQLGGSPASSYQKRTAAGAFTCSGGQVLQAAAADGAPTCVTPSVTETDPKVGTLSDGRVPRWNGGSGVLENGALYDNGAGGNVGVGTASPITQFQVAGRLTGMGASAAGLSAPNSIFVQGRYAFVASSNNNSLVIFDISNPASPVNVGSSASGLSGPTSVYVQGRYAFVANSGSNALVVFDISNPASPVNVGSSASGLSGPISVYVQGRYAFVANSGSNALVVFDISNPASPVNVGSAIPGLNSPRSVYVQGRYAYVASYANSSLVIFDISNPASPVNVGSSTTGLNTPISVYVQGRYAFVASYSNDSLVVFDISNPASPVNVGSSTAGLILPRSVHVQGRYAFVASRINSSLVIFDISNPASPVNVGSSTTGLNQPYSVYVQGRYAFVASNANSSLVSFDLGGAYIQQLEAGGIETGTLATRSNAQIGGDADVKGGLTVGSGGVHSQGGISSPKWQTLTPLPYAGGLPRTSAGFTTNGGRLQITVSTSAYSATSSTLLQVDVYLDAIKIGTLAGVTNEAFSHKALPPLTLFQAAAAGSHTVTLSVGNGNTISDGSDYSQVTVVELPF